MRFLKKIEEIEKDEENFRKEINSLSNESRKEYFTKLNKEIVDPDTYATIIYILYVGGLHHLYFKEYKMFFLEAPFILIGYGLFFTGNESLSTLGALILFTVYLIECPNLFFSQKIARIKNLEIGVKIFSEMKKNGITYKEKENKDDLEETEKDNVKLENI
jgi:hypothetical protein